MPQPQLDVFLLILRLLFIVLLYLFLMQVVIVITRDLRAKAPVAAQGRLVVVDNGPSSYLVPGATFELRPQSTIGRSPTCTIRLADSFISAEHAHIWNRNGRWYVQDAGSTYGTYVNGQPARDPVLVRSGDSIQLGPIRFKLIQQ